MKCRGVIATPEGAIACTRAPTQRVTFGDGQAATMCQPCALALKMQAESFGTAVAIEPIERRPYSPPTIRVIEPRPTLFKDIEKP